MCVCVCVCVCVCEWWWKSACLSKVLNFSDPRAIRRSSGETEDVFISVRKLQFWPLTPFPAHTTLFVTYSSPCILFYPHRLRAASVSSEMNATDGWLRWPDSLERFPQFSVHVFAGRLVTVLSSILARCNVQFYVFFHKASHQWNSIAQSIRECILFNSFNYYFKEMAS